MLGKLTCLWSGAGVVLLVLSGQCADMLVIKRRKYSLFLNLADISCGHGALLLNWEIRFPTGKIRGTSEANLARTQLVILEETRGSVTTFPALAFPLSEVNET